MRKPGPSNIPEQCSGSVTPWLQSCPYTSYRYTAPTGHSLPTPAPSPLVPSLPPPLCPFPPFLPFPPLFPPFPLISFLLCTFPTSEFSVRSLVSGYISNHSHLDHRQIPGYGGRFLAHWSRDEAGLGSDHFLIPKAAPFPPQVHLYLKLFKHKRAKVWHCLKNVYAFSTMARHVLPMVFFSMLPHSGSTELNLTR